MILDHETKQALLTAVDRRHHQLIEQASDLIEQAQEAEQAKQYTLGTRLRERAEELLDRARLLRHLWNDIKPIDVRVSLTK
jgi:hypothetical protein